MTMRSRLNLLLCLLLLQLPSSPAWASPDFETIRPDILFVAGGGWSSLSGRTYIDADSPCIAIQNRFNAAPSYSVTYENGRFRNKPSYGEGCEYESYDRSTGKFLGTFHYQQWAYSRGVCPQGYSGPTTDSNGIWKCVRPTTTIVAKPPICPNPIIGNPVDVGSADKTLRVVDITAADGLGFSRTYRSSPRLSPYAMPSPLGKGWFADHFQSLLISSGAGILAPRVLTVRPDGALLLFVKDGETGRWEAERDALCNVLSEVTLPGALAGYELRLQDGSREIYDAGGRLLVTQLIGGERLSYDYSADGLLLQVKNKQGRALSFEYDYDRRLVAAVSGDGARVMYRHGASHVLASVESAQEISSYSYDSAARLLLVADGQGNLVTSYSYDSQGRPASTERAGGVNRYTLDYSLAGKVVVFGPEGGRTNYSYRTTLGRRLIEREERTCPDCVPMSTSYKHDENLNLTEIQHGFAKTCGQFDSKRSLQIESIEGATVDFDCSTGTGSRYARKVQQEFHPDFRFPVLRRSFDGSGTLESDQSWIYNGRGQLLTATALDPVSGATRTTTTTYCEQPDIDAGTCPLLGLVTSIEGPRTDVNDVTTYTYYPSDDPTCSTSPTTCPHRKGDLWMTMDAAGHVTETLRYDGAGRVLSVKDPNGVVTDFEYLPRGWLTARKVRGPDDATEADDQITRIEYYPTGLVKKTTLPDGSFTTYTYDPAHRLTDITDGEGNTIHYTLDNAGNRTQEDTRSHTGTVLRTLSRVYNQLGQLQTQRDAYAHATGYTYDANGNTDRVTDALNRVTDHDYDPLNRLSQTIQDVGGLNVTTQFQYDALDHLTEVTDPNGHTTKYTWNGLGDLTRLDSPDTGITAYTYDSAGNRRTQTDARGITATYGYDALNRLTTIAYPDSSLDVAYQYDSVAPACTTGETYAAGRLSRITDGAGDTQYCYDRFGDLVRKVQTTAGQRHIVRYAYTKAGQLSAVEYPDGTTADYVRDALGRMTEIGITRPNQPRQILLTSAGHYPFGPVSEWVFGNGRLIQRTLNQNYQPGIVQDQNSGGLSLGYEFDPVGNLAKLRRGDQSEPPLRTYAHDALNRLTETRDGANNALLQGYSYDATGNRTSATGAGVTTPYTIAATSHRLTAVGSEARSYDANGNTTAIGSTKAFVYSVANRMSAVEQSGNIAMTYTYNGKGEQVRRANGTNDITTVYDETGHWLGEYDNSGQPIQQVVWLDDLPVGLIIGPAASNQPLHYIEADALGTPRVVIESQRNVAVWEWPLTGEAFGKDPPNEDPDGDGLRLVFDMRFPGQRYDAATGLNYNYFRDYDSETGRYPQSDPLGLNGGISTYSYVGGSPLTRTDSKGLMWFGPTCSAAQRIAIASQIVQLANEIKEKADSAAKNCTTGDCDWKLAAEVMRWIAHQAYFSCDKQTPCASVWGKGPYVYLYAPYIGAPDASKISSPGQCGCFRSAIFHEAAHVMRYELDEDTIRRMTRGCVSCATNVTESGSPL